MSGDDTGMLLNHISFVIERNINNILMERLGIGFSQFKILLVLSKHPNIKQKVISKSLGQTEASVSRQIKLLTSQGMLTSVRRAENRREHITTLSDRGDRYITEASDLIGNFEKEVFDPLGSKNQDVLKKILLNLHQQVCYEKNNDCHILFKNRE